MRKTKKNGTRHCHLLRRFRCLCLVLRFLLRRVRSRNSRSRFHLLHSRFRLRTVSLCRISDKNPFKSSPKNNYFEYMFIYIYIYIYIYIKLVNVNFGFLIGLLSLTIPFHLLVGINSLSGMHITNWVVKLRCWHGVIDLS